jgi:hypothetical protein
MTPHTNDNDVQRAATPSQAGKEEGFYVDELAAGTVLELETQHHHYTLVKYGGREVGISGHPMYCPEPISVKIEGSVAGRPMREPRPGFIGRGMYLMFKHPVYDIVRTSRIRQIHKLN